MRAVGRSVLFALVGIHGLVFWVVARPSMQVRYLQQQWPNVLWFSALLLTLGLALLFFGRWLGGRAIVRWASVAAAAISVASLANVIEDGFRVDEAFLFFVLSLAIFEVALLALTVVVARTAPDRYRLLAIIPAGTLAAILFFVAAGGPILLITWLISASAASFMPLSPGESPAAVRL